MQNSSKQKYNQLSNDEYAIENKVLDLAIDTGKTAIDILNKAQQNHIMKRAAVKYTNFQHGLMNSSLVFKEDIHCIQGISTNIVSPEIIEKYQQLSAYKKRTQVDRKPQFCELCPFVCICILISNAGSFWIFYK